MTLLNMMPFEMETHAGTPIQVGQTRIIPFAQTVQLTLPGINRFVWSRPTAMLAQTPDGRETVIPVPDITRQTQLALLGLGLLGALILWFRIFTHQA